MRGRHEQNLIGQQFGHLTVIKRDTCKRPLNRKYWVCQCDCGGKISVLGSSLTKNRVTDCGCRSDDFVFLPYNDVRKPKPSPVKEAKPARRCSITDLNDEGCALLLEAFLSNLSEDYYSAYNFFMDNQDDRRARLSYIKLRRFIVSDYFASLTGLDGNVILEGFDRINNIKSVEVV